MINIHPPSRQEPSVKCVLYKLFIIQDTSYSHAQILDREGLLEKCNLLFQNSMVTDEGLRISRHIDDLHSGEALHHLVIQTHMPAKAQAQRSMKKLALLRFMVIFSGKT
jgi:hypothetical protein